MKVFKIVLIVIAAAGAAAFIGWYSTRGAETTYEATAKVLVDQPQTIGLPGGASIPLKIQQLIPTYAQVVMTASTAEKVHAKLSQYSTADIQSALSATNIEKTQILVITATTGNAQKSIDIVRTTAQVFIDGIVKQQDDQKIKPEERLNLSIVESASSVVTNHPPRQRTMMISALAAIIISVGGVMVYENARRA